MRFLLLIILAFGILMPAMAQKKQAASPLVRYSFSDTVAVANIPRTELYQRALAWFRAESQTESFLENIDPSTCTFTAIGYLPFKSQQEGGSAFVNGRIYFRVQVRVFENGYQYELTDFVHQGRTTLNTLTTNVQYPYRPLVSDINWYSQVWNEMKQTANNAVLPRISHLRAGMAKASPYFAPENALSLEALQTADIKWKN